MMGPTDQGRTTRTRAFGAFRVWGLVVHVDTIGAEDRRPLAWMVTCDDEGVEKGGSKPRLDSP